jgi:hypothetical protein
MQAAVGWSPRPSAVDSVESIESPAANFRFESPDDSQLKIPVTRIATEMHFYRELKETANGKLRMICIDATLSIQFVLLFLSHSWSPLIRGKYPSPQNDLWRTKPISP